MKVTRRQKELPGYVGVCFEEHCEKDADHMVIHHHHEGQFGCKVERTDDDHCAMFFCREHAEDTAKGKKVAIKPEIVNRHE